MNILDKANAYIGHPREVDEGYEVSMRRSAFVAGFKEALKLARELIEVQEEIDCLPSYEHDAELNEREDELKAEIIRHLKELEGETL